jgi:hypothetical protein
MAGTDTSTKPGYIHTQLSQSPGSFNWYGSVPTHIADTAGFQPNYRMFDFQVNTQPREPEFFDKVINNVQGEMAPQSVAWLAGSYRQAPMLTTILLGTAYSHAYFCRINHLPFWADKKGLLAAFTLNFAWHNTLKFFVRERYFHKDFTRNQGYALEEIKEQRDEQRGREAIYRLQHEDDPYAEYKVRQWQVSRRFK